MSSIVMKFPFEAMGKMAYQTARAAASSAKVANKVAIVVRKERVNLAKAAATAAKERAKTMKVDRKTKKEETRSAKKTEKEDRKTLNELRKEEEAKTFMTTVKKVEKLGEKKFSITENFLKARADVPEDLHHILDDKKTNNKKWLEENVNDEHQRELVTTYNKARFAYNRVDKNLLKTVTLLENMREVIIGNEKFKELPRLIGLVINY